MALLQISTWSEREVSGKLECCNSEALVDGADALSFYDGRLGWSVGSGDLCGWRVSAWIVHRNGVPVRLGSLNGFCYVGVGDDLLLVFGTYYFGIMVEVSRGLSPTALIERFADCY